MVICEQELCDGGFLKLLRGGSPPRGYGISLTGLIVIFLETHGAVVMCHAMKCVARMQTHVVSIFVSTPTAIIAAGATTTITFCY